MILIANQNPLRTGLTDSRTPQKAIFEIAAEPCLNHQHTSVCSRTPSQHKTPTCFALHAAISEVPHRHPLPRDNIIHCLSMTAGQQFSLEEVTADEVRGLSYDQCMSWVRFTKVPCGGTNLREKFEGEEECTE